MDLVRLHPNCTPSARRLNLGSERATNPEMVVPRRMQPHAAIIHYVYVTDLNIPVLHTASIAAWRRSRTRGRLRFCREESQTHSGNRTSVPASGWRKGTLRVPLAISPKPVRRNVRFYTKRGVPNGIGASEPAIYQTFRAADLAS